MGCFSIYIIIVFIALLPLLFAQLITGAFLILGFSPAAAVFLLFAVLSGSLINIPVKRWPDNGRAKKKISYNRILRKSLNPPQRILAINVGGALIPGLISLWQIYRLYTEFIYRHPGIIVVFPFILLLNILISYKLARPVEGKGIAMPAFIPPIVVSVASLIFYPGIAPVIAFPAGVLGVLIGADLMHLKDIRKLKAPVGSIGGAGTFDGIFLCGILSVFLTG